MRNIVEQFILKHARNWLRSQANKHKKYLSERRQWVVWLLPLFVFGCLWLREWADQQTLIPDFNENSLARHTGCPEDLMLALTGLEFTWIERIPQGPVALETEAWLWTIQLCEMKDSELSASGKSLKYKSLAATAMLLSLASSEETDRQKWSEAAITFNAFAMEGQYANGDAADDLHAQRLIALAVNFYQNGSVTMEELQEQFQRTSKKYLVRKGFCKNKILRRLQADGIIELPVFGREKYI